MSGFVHSGASASVPTETLATVSADAIQLLEQLAGMTGADIWERWDAGLCRELEKHGLVRVVRAKNAPKNGAARQPYFGCKASAAGRKLAAKATGASS